MAVFVPFPRGVQVELIFLLDNVVVENTLWFWNDTLDPGVPELTALAQGVYDWHTSQILPSLSSDLTLQIVVATDWSTQFPLTQGFAGPPVNGGTLAESSTANVALVVGFRWPINDNRHKRNKNYVPGVPENEITLNTPSAAIQSILWDAYVSLIDLCRTWYPTRTWNWVAVSSVQAGAPRAEMHFGQIIGPLDPEQIIIGQRRRRLPS